MTSTTDFLVIGGGVVGISVARALKRDFPDARVTLLEKETACGLHASGRGSGLVYAGLAEAIHDRQATLIRRGSEALLAYCERRGLAVRQCGQLIMAGTPADSLALEALAERARTNGVPFEWLTDGDIQRIEPRAKPRVPALYCPAVASVNVAAVVQALTHDATQEGVRVCSGIRYLARRGQIVLTSGPTYDAGFIVNATGPHADAVARDFGFAARYRVVPFRERYLESTSPAERVTTHICAVPEPGSPFPGVQVVPTEHGTRIGPAMTPAWSREQYDGLGTVQAAELVQLALRRLGMLARGGLRYRSLATPRPRAGSRSRLLGRAASLVGPLRADRYTWGGVGIRAHLVDVERRAVETGYVVESDQRSLHVLSPGSAGFTCALALAEQVTGRIAETLGGGARVSQDRTMGVATGEAVP